MSDDFISTKELNTDFYDAMFGCVHAHGVMNEVERNTLTHVINTLKNPSELSHRIPLLPEMLLKLLDVLKDPLSDVFTYLAIIEQDPFFAAQVLKVANTAKYKHGNKQVVHLRKATSFLGTSGLMKIASTLLLIEALPCEAIFYKLYGRQIWTHSVQCAALCELLAKAEGNNEIDAYFIGLVHDLGRMVVFNCLTEVTGKTFCSITPCSREFKTLMTDLSMEISYLLTQAWQLPSVYVDALLQQRKSHRDGLASLLFRANRLSESYLLWLKQDIDIKHYQQVQKELAISDEIFFQFNNLAPEVAANIS